MDRCSECGADLVRASSGYVCPKGHGKILARRAVLQARKDLRRQQRITEVRLRRLDRLAWIATLPHATQIAPGVWLIDGHRGPWRLSGLKTAGAGVIDAVNSNTREPCRYRPHAELIRVIQAIEQHDHAQDM